MGAEGHIASRRERRRAETHKRLFKAALELMAEHGYDGVTVEMITDRADVAKGTFFNYFPGKDAMVVALCEAHMRTLTELAERSACDPGGRSWWDHVLALLLLAAEQDGASRKVARSMIALGLTNEGVRHAWSRLRRMAFEQFAAQVRVAQRTGEVRADVPPATVARHLAGGYLASLHDWAVSDDDRSLQEVLDERLRLLREGLMSPAQPRGVLREAAPLSPANTD